MRNACLGPLLLGVLVFGGGASTAIHLARPVLAEEANEGRLPDEDPELDAEAQREHEEKVDAIVDDLRREKNQEMVRERIRALGAEKTRVARDALIQYATRNKNHEFVSLAFDALSTMGSLKTLEFLCGRWGLESKNFLVQFSAAEALGRTRDARAAEPLLDVMTGRRTKDKVVSACAIAVARCAADDDLTIQVLLKYSEHRKDTIRAYVMEALGYLKDNEDAFFRLVEGLQEDRNTRVREYAARGLGHTGNPDAIPVLRDAMQDERAHTVRTACAAAIREIGG